MIGGVLKAAEVAPKQRYFTAPDGTKYKWNGEGEPSQEDIDSIVSYHEERSKTPEFKAQGKAAVKDVSSVLSGIPGTGAANVAFNPPKGQAEFYAKQKTEQNAINQGREGLATGRLATAKINQTRTANQARRQALKDEEDAGRAGLASGRLATSARAKDEQKNKMAFEARVQEIASGLHNPTPEMIAEIRKRLETIQLDKRPVGRAMVEDANRDIAKIGESIDPYVRPIGQFIDNAIAKATGVPIQPILGRPEAVKFADTVPEFTTGILGTPINILAETGQLVDPHATIEQKARATANILVQLVPVEELAIGGARKALAKLKLSKETAPIAHQIEQSLGNVDIDAVVRPTIETQLAERSGMTQATNAKAQPLAPKIGEGIGDVLPETTLNLEPIVKPEVTKPIVKSRPKPVLEPIPTKKRTPNEEITTEVQAAPQEGRKGAERPTEVKRREGTQGNNAVQTQKEKVNETGVSMEARRRDAESRGTSMPESTQGPTNKDVFEKAKKDLSEGVIDPDKTLKELANKKHPASQEQIAGFNARRSQLIKRLDEVKGKLDLEPTNDVLRSEYRDILDKADQFDKHLDVVKGENGRSLNAYKIGTKLEDMSYTEITREAKRRYGPDFEIAAKHEKALKSIEAERDAIKAELEVTKSQLTQGSEPIIRKIASGPKRTKDVLKSERQEILSKLTQNNARLSANSFVDPENFALLGKLAKNLVEDGVLTLGELTKKIRSLGVDATDHDVFEALNPAKGTRGLTDTQARLNDLRKQADLVLKIDRAIGGEAPGKTARVLSASETVQGLRQSLKDVLELQGLTEPKTKSKLSSLQKSLEDALETLETGEKKPKVKSIDTPEEAALRAEVERVRSEIVKKWGDPRKAPKSEAARLAQLEKNLKAKNKSLAEGSRPIRGKKPVDTEAIKNIRAQIKDVQRTMNLEDRIHGVKEELRTGDFKVPKEREALNKSQQILKDKLDQLNRMKAARIRSLEPTTVSGKISKFGRATQLLNGFARVFDVISNTSKLASHQVQSPVRGVISELLFRKTEGAERLKGPWTALQRQWRTLEKAPGRMIKDAKEIMKGIDVDTIEKYGKAPDIITRATGLTDVPFRDHYYHAALDDFAASYTKSVKGDKNTRKQIWEQLTEGKSGPLTDAQVDSAKLVAHDWALRQTYNIDNVAAKVVEGMKNTPARFIEQGLPGRFGKEAADGWRGFIDSFTRFSKVIGNVAADKANSVYGGAEAATRLVGAKVAGALETPVPRGTGKLKGLAIKAKGGFMTKIPVKDARLITDLLAKNLTGVAAVYAGKASYDWLKSQDWIEGKIVETEGGTKFVKWTFAPKVFGGIDAGQLGGLFTPYFLGASKELIDKSGLTDKQKDSLWLKYQLGELVNQPLTSGPKDILATISGDKSLGKTAGSILARNVIPGGVSQFAERLDESRTGVELRKSSTFWDEFIKRIPGYRESLPANQKGK